MAIYASKNILTAAGHHNTLQAIYNHFNDVNTAAHWTILDGSAGVIAAAAVVNDYFVVNSKHATIKMQLKFTALVGGLQVESGWKGGWVGVGGVPGAGWNGNPSSTNKEIYNSVGSTTETWVITDIGKVIILIDVARSATVDAACIAAPYTAVEDITVDKYPTFLTAGYPSPIHADWLFDGDHAWCLSHNLTDTVKVIEAAHWDHAYSLSRFSGLVIPWPMVLDVSTAGALGTRGSTDVVLVVPGRADKDTINSKDRIIFNGLAFPWDGTVPV